MSNALTQGKKSTEGNASPCGAITYMDRLGYGGFFEEAEKRAAVGEVQVYCANCELLRWPEEQRTCDNFVRSEELEHFYASESNTKSSMSLPKICTCPTCSVEIPVWWVRDHCAVCGGNLPQTTQQAEIERLRDALAEIDDATAFDYPKMPEASRACSHEIVRAAVLRALTRPNEQAHRQPGAETNNEGTDS